MDRDKFVGVWSGEFKTTIIFNGADTLNQKIDIIESINAGDDVDQILFSKNTVNEIIAIVSDSMFNIPEQIQINIYKEKLYESSITGQGVLSKDHVLTISSKRVTFDKGNTIEWICTETLKLK